MTLGIMEALLSGKEQEKAVVPMPVLLLGLGRETRH